MSKFSIKIAGDTSRETIASINYEKRIDNIEIEIPPKSEKFVFLLDDFFRILEKAKKSQLNALKKMRNLEKRE